MNSIGTLERVGGTMAFATAFILLMAIVLALV
jgi:hypothetical protein